MKINKLEEQISEETMEEISQSIKESKDKSFTQDVFSPGKNINSKIAGLIDHTLLKPDATSEQIKKLCNEALEYKFASVCVNPSHIPLVVELLDGSVVKACTVIGFPLGATTTRTKVEEAKEAIENGATEVDMVINVGASKSGNWELVKSDIEAVVNVSKGKALVKVIIETCFLNDEEKIKASSLAKLAGADFVKTSTGFGSGGASVEDICLMRNTVGSDMGVKASGGVRDYKTAMEMVNAGATRIGTSSGVEIVKTEKVTESLYTEINKSTQVGEDSPNCTKGNATIAKDLY